MREPNPGGTARRGGTSAETLADEASFAALRQPAYMRVEDIPAYDDLPWDERAVVVLRAGGADAPNSARRLRFTINRVNSLLIRACRTLGYTSPAAAAEALRWPSSERRLPNTGHKQTPRDPRSPHILFRIGDRVHRHHGLEIEIGAVSAINTDMLLIEGGGEWLRRLTHLGSRCP